MRMFSTYSGPSIILSQEPSVALALQILDGSPLRPGDKLNMSVTPAKFEQKGKIRGGKVSGPGWAISSTRYKPKQVVNLTKLWSYDLNTQVFHL